MAVPPDVAAALGERGLTDLAEVGRGGFSVVYRATQDAFDRTVAVKVISRLDLDETARRHFERECKAMGRLSSHPHIVTLYDAAVLPSGMPYLVMEYLEAGSLADRLRRDGPLPAEDVARVGTEVADALQAAHDAGLVHRDVKPGNILCGTRDEAKLSDFGIAAIGTTSSATATLAATWAHAAPEVFQGKRPTTASDIYSLGSTLYELLVGHPAFVDGDDDSIAAIAYRAVHEPTPDLREEGVPDSLAEVIETAIAKDPSKRHTTADEMAVDLRETGTARAGAAMPPETKGRTPSVTEPDARDFGAPTRRRSSTDLVGTSYSTSLHESRTRNSKDKTVSREAATSARRSVRTGARTEPKQVSSSSLGTRQGKRGFAGGPAVIVIGVSGAGVAVLGLLSSSVPLVMLGLGTLAVATLVAVVTRIAPLLARPARHGARRRPASRLGTAAMGIGTAIVVLGLLSSGLPLLLLGSGIFLPGAVVALRAAGPGPKRHRIGLLLVMFAVAAAVYVLGWITGRLLSGREPPQRNTVVTTMADVSGPDDEVRPPSQVRVLVLNAARIEGAAEVITERLKIMQYRTLTGGNAPTQDETVVYYNTGYQAEAAALAPLVSDIALAQALPEPTPFPALWNRGSRPHRGDRHLLLAGRVDTRAWWIGPVKTRHRGGAVGWRGPATRSRGAVATTG